MAGRSGKLTRFDELVTDLLDAGEQALVFTQFREMGLLLQQHLHERFGTQVPFLHGGVPKAQRDHMVDVFQSGAAPSPLLLVSLRAGGTGLNLTAASRVVHYDRWWNPAIEDQAAVEAFYAAEKPDTVIMAAAKVGGIHANNTYPADFGYDNLVIATNTIHGAL